MHCFCERTTSEFIRIFIAAAILAGVSHLQHGAGRGSIGLDLCALLANWRRFRHNADRKQHAAAKHNGQAARI